MKNNVMINNRTAKIAIGILLLAYILSPVDLVSDVIPVAGWLDDLMAAVILAKNLYSMFGEKNVQETMTDDTDIPEAEVIDR